MDESERKREIIVERKVEFWKERVIMKEKKNNISENQMIHLSFYLLFIKKGSK